MITGVYTSAVLSARPQFHRIHSSRVSVLLLFAINVLICLNLVRLLHISDTAVINALPSNPQVSTQEKASNMQPTLVTQTYAPVSTAPGSAADDAAAIAAASTPATAPSTQQTPKGCTGSQYALPLAQDLSGAQGGLVKTIDQPTYYQIYGNSVTALRASITNCPYRKAAGSYQAATSYQLNWRYSATSVGNNQCQLTNIRVGLHINQLMPTFVPTSGTPAAVASTWNRYAANLATHEAGHIDIDTQYAEKLLAALQAMGPLDCSLISRQAQTTIDSYVTMLNAANDLYDSRTNHGATQGAVL